MVSVQLNVPAAATVAPQDPIVAPAPTVVVTVIAPPVVVVGVNPLPDTRNDAPVGPCEGVSVIVGVVIVNMLVELSKIPSEPVATTV